MTGGRPVRLAPPDRSPRPPGLFPAVDLASGTRLWRCHRSDRGPWWFSSDGAGRFDLPTPHGTCYLADDPLLALVEVISHGTLDGLSVTPAFCAQRRIRHLSIPSAAHMADATDGRARGFGVSREIHDIADYTLPQAWATAWRTAGFNGVRYLATNHQPVSYAPPWPGPGAQGPGSWALFGSTGHHPRWRRGRAEHISPTLLTRLETETGILVIGPPTLAAASIVTPPP